MPNCPICTTEYVDGSLECSNCGWDLKIEINSQNSNSIPDGFGPNENPSKILTSIQKVWNKAQTSNNLSSDITQLQELENKLEAANETIKEISQERDKFKKELEQHEGNYQQKPLDESSEQQEVLRKSIERIYQLEISDKGKIQQLQEINKKIKNIENSLVFFLKESDVESIYEKINKIETDVENCKEKIGLIESKNVKSEGDYYSEESSQSYSSQAEALSKRDTNISNIPDERPLTIEEYEVVQGYNTYQQNVPPNNVIEVNATDESIENARIRGEGIILKKQRRGKGNYWIVNQNGFYYLAPKKGIPFNEYSYNTAEILFECRLKQQERTQNFRLLKPAKLSELPEGEQWRLESRGILEFY